MIILVQIIHNFNYQKIPSVIVTIDAQKYIFNVFDGFQRYRSDQNYGITKSPHYFFTQLNAETLGGFFCQTINTFTGAAFQSKIYGPKNTVQFFENLRQQIIVGQYILPFSAYEFMTNKCMLGINDMKTFDQLSKNPNSKDQIEEEEKKENQKQQKQQQHNCDNKVLALYNKDKRHSDYLKQHLKPNQINDASKYIKNNSYYQDQYTKIIPIPLYNNKNLMQAEIILSYIFVINEMKEKFDKEKLAKTIPKSKHGELFKKGEIIIDGKKFVKADFLEKQQKSPVIIIIDCPQIEYLESLINNYEFTAFYENNINKDKQYVSLIIHTSQNNIIQDQKYIDFISKFGNNVNHLFCDQNLNEKNVDQHIIDTQAKQFKNKGFIQQLNDKFPKFFPKFNQMDYEFVNERVFEKSQNPEKDQLCISQIMNNFIPENLFLAKKYFHFKVLPQQNDKNTKYNHFPHFKVDDLVQIEFNENFKEIYQQYLQKYSESLKVNQQQLQIQQLQQDNLEVVFLGTAAMMPAQYRNVSCILLRKQNVNVIFDCGEGSFGQFYERFNYTQQQNKENTLYQELKKLKYIVISHNHEDHFIGTINLLKQRQNILGDQADTIFLVVSNNVYPFLRNYLELIEKFKDLKIILTQHIKKQEFTLEDFIFDFNFQSNEKVKQNLIDTIYKKELQQLENNYQEFIKENEKQNIQFSLCDVIHCPQSSGILVTFTDLNKSISYSGDTRPCEDFINISQNCDLMIHEATFSSALYKNAKQNMHSTVYEALDSAIKAKSKYLALTHFSQRYSKKADIENFEDQNYQNYYKNNTIVALDHFGFKMQDIDEAIFASQACLQLACDEQ